MSNNSLLIIGFIWPEPKSSAAGSRMLQLILEFQKQGYKITFSTTAKKSKNAFNLQSISVDVKSIELNSSSFDDFIKVLQPNIVLFDRFMTEEQFGWRVAEHCPNAVRILDTEDFHGLRKGRAEALKNKEVFSIKHLHNDTTKREVASIYRSDLSLIISEAEIDILVNDLGVKEELLYYLPFLLHPTSDEDALSLPSFENRQHFITIGNFLHPPNFDSVLYLKNEIWPQIRKALPSTQLHIYGSYESQKVTQLHNEKDGFLVKGFTDSVDEVMQTARVCLAPLRFGAGLKGKLIDAMQNGTPCVMTSIAVEGMFASYNANGLVSDEPYDFANKAVTLYNDCSQFSTFQNNGFIILKERFNVNRFSAKFSNKIHNILQNFQQYRQRNFTGQLLMHQSLQSTKYMSKWIEAKNK